MNSTDNRLNLVNKKGLTNMFTKSSLGCTRKRGINKINTSSAVQRPRGYLIAKTSGRFGLLLHTLLSSWLDVVLHIVRIYHVEVAFMLKKEEIKIGHFPNIL